MGDELAPEMDWAAGIIPGTTQNLDPALAGGSGFASGTGTGQHGVATMDDSGSGGILGIWDWLHKPFRTPLDPLDLGIIVGIVLVAWLFWGLFLYHVRIAAETI